MALTIHLLGRPHLETPSGNAYSFRSRKSWALLAYLILTENSPSRSQLASLLFSEADDPLRALRWSLSEIRRGLGNNGTLTGNPVTLKLHSNVGVDVLVISHKPWNEAILLPGLGSDLLEGTYLSGAAVFEAWLLSQQRRMAAASESVLHEAALRHMTSRSYEIAIDYAIRAAQMSPFDENHQILLIRLYRLSGDDQGADRQFALCKETFARELGITPSPALVAAMRQPRFDSDETADRSSIAALVEAGSAAVSAGAVDTGVQSLRTAVELSDQAGDSDLRIGSRLTLAETLIHSLRGYDEEGIACLHEADEIAAVVDPDAVANVRAELGYVDFLRARYDRSERWLNDALEFGKGDSAVRAKALAYLGSLESDRGNYQRSLSFLNEAVEISSTLLDRRRQAFASSMLGRVHFLLGDLTAAAEHLDISISLAEADHWLAFLPWPQTLRGEVQLALGDNEGAGILLGQAFARACQLGDPCWEGMSARGLAMVSHDKGDSDEAFLILSDARSRCNRLADPYVWLDGYILDAQCELGRLYGHPDTQTWVDTLQELAARTAMKELTVRSLLHGAALGREADAAAARLLVVEVDNPRLTALTLSSKDARRGL